MPRPKGSKNKKIVDDIFENIDEKIAETEAAIATLTKELKAKKTELKVLIKAKAEADKKAAEKKAEEDKEKLLKAFETCGKSVEDVISMLQGE